MAAFRRFINLFRHSEIDRDINAELQAHIDLRMDANIAAGMSPEEARRQALVQFGNRHGDERTCHRRGRCPGAEWRVARCSLCRAAVAQVAGIYHYGRSSRSD